MSYPKKTLHYESLDSGLDLSLSTNSSVQVQQYSQQHLIIHRPLSALNEDPSPDDGYHEEQHELSTNARLRFPPVSFGRNRSMEDMISNRPHEQQQQQQQHRSSSFSDERQQKLLVKQDQTMKRCSDGALLDLRETHNPSKTSQRSVNSIQQEFLHPPHLQHRSLNDLTNKYSNKGKHSFSSISFR